ncbi:chorismate mutase [Prosthecobacter sp.]|uniref:chorismate mutase n=1 Tax=Prosthecobacter sp. TaxID=1965333 RepID=UPI0037836642
MNCVFLFRLPGVFALGVVLLLSSCASRRTLPALMVERLGWMDKVAMAKQIQHLPTTDPVREAELLRAVTQRGVAAGVEAKRVRSFFQGQMQAAKVRQEEWLRQHPQGVTSEVRVPSLTKTVRPALDEIGKRMIDELARETGILTSQGVRSLLSEAEEHLTRAGYSAAVRQPAMEGLQEALKIDLPMAERR